ncbi:MULTISPECIES: cellulose biosynthesis protein BcsQ [unclassified Undibacterium]|uniref:cellulose biosynthesis protein BcsQ n=1 Tax=unclassified Undibacterium TaxID=2630295 RepID=UPI002AC958A9|nr:MULTISPECIES: cellulose biosynthesis protein BcsQ [unclassified Undibacterium]MEB0137556.1 cellulose biosynthesis protein BcsQ [Undibacterium sp. CCC2.1]MEB0170557.1 cellulose biosynthesis protein BcsQ [Undibacterium sp. CCC1.1]MEB0174498.1 cellulose biosynthesis protein BcsQ [Undibacterium sp. CCC3.4]MEB0213705.1 cellulose biosynthesis protein BcsQ [Undibacterium sp. 5I2]WPX43870.1 cellulose biosynthesis protein BcsQ [Undibacterium sp. CCC3.4]
MRIVAVISPKGGVGKTTVTANLAASLARLGARVSVLDLDPQNALRLHFGMPYDQQGGIAGQDAQGRPWREVLYESAFGVDFIPYGTITEKQRDQFEAGIRQQPDWLATRLAAMQLDDNAVLLIDTPPGPSLYLQQVLNVANVALVVLRADAASYSTVPAIEALLAYYTGKRSNFFGYCYVVNQMDASKQLCRDVVGMLRSDLGARFVSATIHRDEAVSEALACQSPVAYYAKHSSATHDVEQLSIWLQKNFGLVD